MSWVFAERFSNWRSAKPRSLPRVMIKGTRQRPGFAKSSPIWPSAKACNILKKKNYNNSCSSNNSIYHKETYIHISPQYHKIITCISYINYTSSHEYKQLIELSTRTEMAIKKRIHEFKQTETTMRTNLASVKSQVFLHRINSI